MDEFYAFLEDSKMLSKNLPLSEIQKIFKIVNDEGEGFNDPLNPDFEFTPGEFAEAIIHIAERRSRGTKKESTSLSSKVKRCLADYILPARIWNIFDRDWLKAIVKNCMQRTKIVYSIGIGNTRKTTDVVATW